MKKTFYPGLVGLLLFEIANVYFIMPMPGSQEMNSLDVAYLLYTWRWVFRLLFGGMMIFGLKSAFAASKWLPSTGIAGLLVVIYNTSFEMAADTMFYQPTFLALKDTTGNVVDKDRLILGITCNGQSKAYPIQFLGYHHQVRDSIGGKPIMVTYCTVCRTGRVYEPLINNTIADFRLVGMDHFNAMFEDKSTKSWWRQATGEAVAGPLKGQSLPEFPSTQMTLNKWIELYPNTLIMQPDQKFQVEYDSMKTYEQGRLFGNLTRRDTNSWQSKSWVIGVTLGKESKAYDWNKLQQERILYDAIDNQPIAVILSKDNSSFVVLQRVNNEQQFTLNKDTLVSQGNQYTFMGISIDKHKPDLKKINAYQEYWHSWQTFHPGTGK